MITSHLVLVSVLAMFMLLSPVLPDPRNKPAPEHPCGQNAHYEKLPDGSTQCYTKRKHKTNKVTIK